MNQMANNIEGYGFEPKIEFGLTGGGLWNAAGM